MHCGGTAAAAASGPGSGDAEGPAFTRTGEAVSLIMARAADPEDSLRNLATGLCADLLFAPSAWHN